MGSAYTSYHALLKWEQKTPDRAFLHQPVDGVVKTFSWGEAAETARRFANALLGVGLRRGDKVAILAKNSAEWFIADCAMMMAGVISVPIYPTAESKTIRYVLDHCEAKAIIIGKLDNWQEPEGALPESIITIGMPYKTVPCRYSWEELVASTEPLQEFFEPDKSDILSILYTSGSTGNPKGVCLSYGAYEYACQTCCDLLDYLDGDRTLSYLPLAHITERAVLEGPAIFSGVEVYFSDRLDTFQEDLRRSKATLFISVPRLWVKFQAGVHAQISPLKLRILLSLPIIGKLVARKVKETLGLAHARLVGSGSAPISPLTLKWYSRLGINISEGWGMTETCGLSCGNNPYRKERIGTIGVPIPGTEMKLSDQGEILLRSPALFTEYYKEPELTTAAFTDDGFLRTGDKGEWDEKLQAFRITGRIKDIFKSAKGKYVTPVPIESKLSANPYFEQICVMGSGLPAPVAVVVLSLAAKPASRETIEESLQDTLQAVNEQLESHERLSNIFVVKDEWTIENELLTPTLKVKRDKIEAKYRDLISRKTSAAIEWE